MLPTSIIEYQTSTWLDIIPFHLSTCMWFEKRGTYRFQEELTTYVFRYTYANGARKLGYSKDLIAESLGHEYGNAVTGIYLELFDQQTLDAMAEHILEVVTNQKS